MRNGNGKVEKAGRRQFPANGQNARTRVPPACSRDLQKFIKVLGTDRGKFPMAFILTAIEQRIDANNAAKSQRQKRR